MRRSKKYLWMAVTADKYEFPIYITDNIPELAEKVGMTRSSLSSAISRQHSGRNKEMKFVRIDTTEGDM